MGFTCGIIGLPNVGKSTIFNALTRANAHVANYPFTTIDPNKGIVKIPDNRLKKLAELVKPDLITPTTLEFFDIAGLVKGASNGEGLGNKFLGNIRDVDAIAHVVRCFEDKDVSHVEDDIDPIRDIETINTELILADIEVLQKRIAKDDKLKKVGEKDAEERLDVYKGLMNILNEGKTARTAKFNDSEMLIIYSELNLITSKPVIYIANVGEDELLESQDYSSRIEKFSVSENSGFVKVCGKIEAEISELPEDEREEFIKEMGLKTSAIDSIIKCGYQILALITFYTTVGTELRAWTIKKGTPAIKAAGKIHSDFERGFIKAEIISFDDFVKAGSEHHASEMGLMHLEGKDYIVQDGDVIRFKFNV